MIECGPAKLQLPLLSFQQDKGKRTNKLTHFQETLRATRESERNPRKNETKPRLTTTRIDFLAQL